MTSSFAVFYVRNFLVNILYLMFVSNYSVSDVVVDEEDFMSSEDEDAAAGKIFQHEKALAFINLQNLL